MSLLAGAIARRPHAIIPEDLRADLDRLVSRDSKDKREVARTPWAHLVKVDIRAFKSAGAVADPEGRATFITGDPALHTGPQWFGGSRADDLPRLHAAASAGKILDVLREASGTFSLAHLDPSSERLWLATDKCGMRPLYVWIGAELIVFASALRVLEELTRVPKQIDRVAIAQKVAWTFVLGNRTPHAEIKVLRPGEAFECGPDGVTIHQYWHWHQSQTSAVTEAEHGALWYERLSSAIARRRGSDQRVVSYLTGGMDSRAIVCELLQQHTRIDSVNGSYPGELDQVLGQMFAEAVGTRHLEVPRSVGDPQYPAEIAKAWLAHAEHLADPPERPHLIWAGVNGSVAIGHIHMNEQLVAEARKGVPEKTVEFYLRGEHLSLPLRLFRKEKRQELYDAVIGGYVDEMNRFPFADPARSLHVALALNDTRRAFATNLEALDLHRLDSCIPLADARLLEVVFASPFDLCLWHGLYSGMVEPLKATYQRVGWQTYAGHRPSAVPTPPGPPHQRSKEQLALRRRAARPRILRRGWAALTSSTMPWDTISRPFLALVLGIYALNLRDVGYYLNAAADFGEAARPKGEVPRS